MPDGTRKRGAKPLGTKDWLFGSAPRRRLLTTVLTEAPPPGGWTKRGLALATGVSPNGGLDEHVAGLARLGLLEQRDRRWHPGPARDLGDAVTRVLAELDALPGSFVS
jgi:hypothetical protein